MDKDESTSRNPKENDAARAGKEWNVPKPDAAPYPMYWPAFLAFGCALTGLGVLTSYIFSILGGVIVIFAVAKWIGEMLRENNEQS
jgi:hypothetical protein